MITKLMRERTVSIERACNFFQCEEEDICLMMESETIDTNKLIGWSKLLGYDFFRVYSQHLILYAPNAINSTRGKKKLTKGGVPVFRKNIYTKEIIDYLLGLIRNKEKTATQVIEEYRIPKTTLYRWIQKYEINKK